MKPTFSLLSLLVLLVLPACGPGTDPAVGKWKLDNEAVVAAAMTQIEEMPNLDEAGKKQMANAMRPSLETTTGELELKADGTSAGRVTMPSPVPGAEPVESAMVGRWTNDNGKIALTLDGEGDAAKKFSGELELDVLTLREESEGTPMTFIFQREN